MKIRVLGAEALRRALPISDTIEAMKRAFAAYSSSAATVPQRLSIAVPPDDGVLLVKPALIPGAGLGAKLVSIFPGNAMKGRPVISGLVVLFDEATGEPVGVCDGGFLTAWRTGAASGAATDLLARTDAAVGAIIGCGVQGRTQAVGIDAVRDLEEIRLFDTDTENMEAMIAEASPTLRTRLVPMSSPDAAVDGADIICTATTSGTPVFDGRSITDGAHINGIGSFNPAMCEVDDEIIRRARIVVDSREAAQIEAGELVKAVGEGLTDPANWIEVGEIVNGERRGRESNHQVSFFKSVGIAAQDISAAALAFPNSAVLGLGTEVDLG